MCLLWCHVVELVVEPLLQHMIQSNLNSIPPLGFVVGHRRVHLAGKCHVLKVVILYGPHRGDFSQPVEAPAPEPLQSGEIVLGLVDLSPLGLQRMMETRRFRDQGNEAVYSYFDSHNLCSSIMHSPYC